MLYIFFMSRAFFVGIAVLAAACGNKSSTPESLCVAQVPPPAACATECDPSPGAATTCPTGFHCSTAGKCDTLCTPSGNECGDGNSCTSDGLCVSNGTGSGSGSGDDGPDANCPNVQFTATKVIPSIQLLIDRSGSMRQDFNNNEPPVGDTKYAVVQSALVGPAGVVTQLAPQVYFGASMFPSNACPKILELDRSLNNASSITSFLAANPPAASNSSDIQSTPTPPAIDAVVADFHDNPAPQGSPPVIVLATDGAPNTCTNNRTDTKALSVAATKRAFAAGIKLYILAVGSIADVADHLQEMANAGLGITPGAGVTNAKVFLGTSPADLSAAFQEIIRGVVSCDLTLNGTVEDDAVSSGVVTLNGTTLTYQTDWTLDTNGTVSVIHLVGTACTTLKNAANPTVDAVFPCGGGVILF